MDEFINIVRQQCVHEQVMVLHILLHADDTAVLSTNQALFIRKCDVLLAAFKDMFFNSSKFKDSEKNS